MAKADYRDVIDACYRPAPSNQAWCASFVDALTPLVPYGTGAFIAIFSVRGGAIGLACVALQHVPESVGRLATVLAPSMDLENEGRLLFSKSPLNLVSSAFPIVTAASREFIRRALADGGARDLLGVLGYPVHNSVAALALPLRSAEGLTPRARAALLRIRLHMELSLSHRLQPTRQPIAVLRSDGQLVHLAHTRLDDDTLTQLGQHVRTVERVRRRCFPGDSFDALMLWDALVAGRFSTFEQVDADGRRHHLVYENTNAAHRHRALSPQESETLRLYAAGKTGKEVAAALDQAPSTISERLASIADKLGLRSRDDVLRLHARANADGSSATSVPLTAAERDVLVEVVNGRRDAEIARHRSTSVNTVRKQVASLRQKLGAPTRKQLASRSGEASA